MLDITLLKQQKEQLVASEKSRYAKSDINYLIKLDEEWRDSKYEMDNANRAYNSICKDMGSLFKKKDKSEDDLKGIESLKSDKLKSETNKKDLITKQQEKLDLLLKEWKKIGNIVHPSVPISNDEANNVVVRKWDPKLELVPDSDKARPTELLSHHQLLDLIGGYAPEQGVKVAGHRGYFLTGVGCKLWRALSNFGISFLEDKEYTELYTPFYMKKEVMARTAQLSQFDEELYKMVGEEEAYLIATSEQPISAFHMNEWIDPSRLPVKYAGYSTCFRKEAGAHGKDTWGIFRIHQFEKIEQFVITSPEKSWEMHEQMIYTAEEFYQLLNIPYRVVAIVSGALNNSAAKKYDLDAWFPFQNEYKELVSCSNCTDYQARDLEIRYGFSSKTKDTGDKPEKNEAGDEKKYVHLLNSTLCAVQRAMCCILENYQTEDGVVVPKVLRPFIGKDFLPFVKDKSTAVQVHAKIKKGKK